MLCTYANVRTIIVYFNLLVLDRSLIFSFISLSLSQSPPLFLKRSPLSRELFNRFRITSVVCQSLSVQQRFRMFDDRFVVWTFWKRKNNTNRPNRLYNIYYTLVRNIIIIIIWYPLIFSGKSKLFLSRSCRTQRIIIYRHVYLRGVVTKTELINPMRNARSKRARALCSCY